MSGWSVIDSNSRDPRPAPTGAHRANATTARKPPPAQENCALDRPPPNEWHFINDPIFVTADDQKALAGKDLGVNLEKTPPSTKA